MSSNFVPQQLPVPSMDRTQLEPGLKNVGSPMQEVQMGAVGSVSTGTASQQFLMSNSLMEMIPNYSGAQGLSTAYIQMSHIANASGNVGAHKFYTPSNQVGEMGGLATNVGSYQSASLKRKTPFEPMFLDLPHQTLGPNKRVAQVEHRPWLQQAPAANKIIMQSESMASAPGSQNMLASSKKMVKMDSFPGISGPQRSLSQKNQTSQIQPSPKGQNESFESVRSKMRESLAAALALVNQQQDKSLESEIKSQKKPQETCDPGKHEFKEEPKDDSPSRESCSAPKSNSVESASLNIMSDTNTSDSALTSIPENKQFQSNGIMPYEVPFGDNLFVKDDLLQGNGLSWVLESDIQMSDRNKNFPDVKHEEINFPEEKAVQSQVVQSPEELASEIEAELFKLFGGVNKKYKEKGRSLLFNLKDQNNPELRERVMSREITPGRLCSMTAEELASKELSEWRQAKAEELAQMIVLPDSELDMRRLVKKTHKGEVEVEQFDNAPTDVPISHEQSQPRSKKPEVSTPAKSDMGNGQGQNRSMDESYTFPSSDGSDLLQGLMVDDELKDLPPIVSLDEFMKSLDNEPPFEIPPEEGTPESLPSQKEDSENGSHVKEASENEYAETGSQLKSSGLSPKDYVHSSPQKDDEINGLDSKPEPVIKSDGSLAVTKSEEKPVAIKLEDNLAEGKNSDNTSDGAVLKSGDSSADLVPRDGPEKTDSTPVQKFKGEHLWGGVLQLSVSTKASVIGIFKSGEKASAKDWPRSLEIKGRVRLDAFEKFLQELPQSRSRAVMVVHFVAKEGSPETETASLSEVLESYITDERVGFAEPCSGVEMYLCPLHSKICGMLSTIIQKEHVEELNSIDNGLVGVIVWRKLTSPKPSLHQKHALKKQHYSSSSRRPHDAKSNVNHNSKPSEPSRVLPPHRRVTQDEEDELPPGFGPPASRDDDDLPEFNFSVPSNQYVGSQRPSRGSGGMYGSETRPVDKMRELILKYGQNDRRASWNKDDDDDMPEWQPSAPPAQYQRPQAPSSYEQPYLRPHMGSPLQQHQPLQASNPYWQQGNQWAPPPLQSSGVWPGNVASQPESGWYNGNPDRGSAGLPWRQNAPRSRGF